MVEAQQGREIPSNLESVDLGSRLLSHVDLFFFFLNSIWDDTGRRLSENVFTFRIESVGQQQVLVRHKRHWGMWGIQQCRICISEVIGSCVVSLPITFKV